MRALLNSVLIVLLCITVSGGCRSSGKKKPVFYDPTNPMSRPADAALLLTMINDMRANNSVAALVEDPLVTVAAEAYANFFAAYWSETGMQPYVDNLDGLTPTGRLTNAGVTFTACGETGLMDMGWQDASYVINVLDTC